MGNDVLAKRQEKKYVKPSEFILYLVAVFFYTNMTGMIGSYRNAYIVNVLRLTDDQASLYNTLLSVVPFFLNFFIAMYILTEERWAKGESSDRLRFIPQFPREFCL